MGSSHIRWGWLSAGVSINRDRLARTVRNVCALWLQKRGHLQEVGDTLKSTVWETDRTRLELSRPQSGKAKWSVQGGDNLPATLYGDPWWVGPVDKKQATCP